MGFLPKIFGVRRELGAPISSTSYNWLVTQSGEKQNYKLQFPKIFLKVPQHENSNAKVYYENERANMLNS